MRADKFGIVLRVHYFCWEPKKRKTMKTKLFACAALLLAACGGAPSAQKAAESRTEVKHGPEIVLSAPDTVGGPSVRRWPPAVRGASTAPIR